MPKKPTCSLCGKAETLSVAKEHAASAEVMGQHPKCRRCSILMGGGHLAQPMQYQPVCNLCVGELQRAGRRKRLAWGIRK